MTDYLDLIRDDGIYLDTGGKMRFVVVGDGTNEGVSAKIRPSWLQDQRVYVKIPSGESHLTNEQAMALAFAIIQCATETRRDSHE